MTRPTIHIALAEKIRQDILSYRDGWEIPSVRSLARQYGVATNTVRRALGLLAAQNEIVLPGPGSQYVRRLPRARRAFCRPYPGVGLLHTSNPPLAGEGYIPMLVATFIATLRENQVPVLVLPPPRNLDMDLIPGGAAIRTPPCRFSAVAFVQGCEDSMLAALVRTGAVVMTLDFVSSVEGVDAAVVDCRAEAQVALACLARLGHRHIAFLGASRVFGPSHWVERVDPDVGRFGEALLEAKRQAGLNADPSYHLCHQTDLAQTDAGVRTALDRLWRLDPPPTALVCFDSASAEQARRVLSERGLRCPADVSILTRDFARTSPCGCTHLMANPCQIGTAAAMQLLQRLSNPASQPTRLEFPSALVEGSTTGQAPAV